MSRLLSLTAGAVVLIAAATGFIVVPEHAPSLSRFAASGAVVDQCAPPNGIPGGFLTPCSETHVIRTGWSQTGYDAARVATWACVIVGVISVAVCLIGYARRPRPGPA